MKKYDLYISFKNRTIMMKDQTVEIENIRKDLIQECTFIETRNVEALFKEDKIVEIVVWSLTKKKGDIE
jgi:hypothetical protein